MNITIFCSMKDAGGPYTSAAREFATTIGENGHTLVWGGTNSGTMKVIADAAQAAGGRIVGITVEPIKQNARSEANEMIVEKTWPERRATLLARGDAIVVLPGGIGTLDEATEVLEYKKQDMHAKPIVFLNSGGFYEGFKLQLERMEKEGFLTKALADFLYFADTPEDAMRYIEAHGA